MAVTAKIQAIAAIIGLTNVAVHSGINSDINS